MSRIGKNPVTITKGVSVTVGSDNVVTVKGPKGELKQAVDPDIKVEVDKEDPAHDIQLEKAIEELVK